jgi:hypothetical protein
MAGRLQKELDELCVACLRDIGADQYGDLRRFFFAGAAALYGLLMRSVSTGCEATPEDMALMVDLAREIRDFNEAVKRGEA